MRNILTKTDFPYFVESVAGSNDDIITLAALKEWLRIDVSDTSEDAILTGIRDGVISYFESATGLVLLETTFRTTRDVFANRCCYLLKKAPYVSLESFEYLVDNVLTAVPTNLYYEDIRFDDGYSKINRQTDVVWPTNIDRRTQAIAITFKAGYAGFPTGIPEEIIQAMLNHMANWYEMRGDCDTCKCDEAVPGNAGQVYDQVSILDFGMDQERECLENDLPMWGNSFFGSY